MIDFTVRSALYVPANNARALAKAISLRADLIILDLEDAVPPDQKDDARLAAIAAVETFGERPVAIRINAAGSAWHHADVCAIAASQAHYVVLPKVENSAALAVTRAHLAKPIVAMIETPLGVYAARDIAASASVIGLLVGCNDLAAQLKVPGREGLSTCLQLIILAARAAGIWVLDGVYNGLADAEGLAAECAAGRSLGFDGKTLIHPNQIEACRAAFSPTPAEIEEARALILAVGEGAQRFRSRMIEAMHVRAAHEVLRQIAEYKI